MPERRSSLTEPRLERLLEQVGSKFLLVALGARRARDINDYYNHLGEGLGRLVPPQVTSVARKPLSIALEEVEAGKIRLAEEHEGASGEHADGTGAPEGPAGPGHPAEGPTPEGS